MSWMDSWSRPGKSQATPAPFYLQAGGEATAYCRSCGRVIGARRANNTEPGKAGKGSSSSTTTTTNKKKSRGTEDRETIESGSGDNAGAGTTKYCSQRCRAHKPRRQDREIEAVFAALLQGREPPPSLPPPPPPSTGLGPVDANSSSSSPGSREGGTPGNDDANPRHVVGEYTSTVKGDPRLLVSCSAVEELVFGARHDPTKRFGRRKDRASRVLAPSSPSAAADENRADSAVDVDFGFRSDEEEDAEPEGGRMRRTRTDEEEEERDAAFAVRSGTRVRPAQAVSQVNGSVGGEKGRAERRAETEEMEARRREGQRRAQQREMVRCAARRGVVFGFPGEEGGAPRKCEAVMQGKVVEPSFAKGDWAVRWRE
ncbi:hypothetical protein F4780DRAFT_778950 [Xylariomycetidae sp. FL0641]|nr:hypothetical protein F4780DRAFT_778950 [Xylariomycetidae sp. FL0641]